MAGNLKKGKGKAPARAPNDTDSQVDQENQDPNVRSEVAKLQASLATATKDLATARQDFNTALADIRKDVLNIQQTPAPATSIDDGPAFQEKVNTAVNARFDVKLKEPATITYLDHAFRVARMSSSPTAPTQANDVKEALERMPELTALVHNVSNCYLQKRHPSSIHWPALASFEDELGTMRYWPRGSPTHVGPLHLTVAQVIAENVAWDTAYADKVDMAWSSPFSVAEKTITRGAKAALLRDSSMSDDDEGASDAGDDEELVYAEPVVEVYRPDFLDKSAPSSQAFRLAVGTEIEKILAGPKNTQGFEFSPVDIVNAIRQYWETAAKEYKSQLTAEKRNSRRCSKRKDRRKMRMKRALEGRDDWFDKSPLSGTVNADRLRWALADQFSFVPELLSDDEEGRFFKTDGLDERELNFRLEMSNRVSYNPKAAWESREAFFLTAEVRLASILLDDFVHKKTASGSKPVFRAPIQATQKDWAKPEWPLIREKDPSTGLPKANGKGSVIYRFMVNHDRLRNLPNYQAFNERLYDDPPAVAESSSQCSSANGQPLTLPTLEARCAETQFAGLNLWETACRRYNSMVTPRDRQPVLMERYRQMEVERSGIRDDFGEEAFSFV